MVAIGTKPALTAPPHAARTPPRQDPATAVAAGHRHAASLAGRGDTHGRPAHAPTRELARLHIPGDSQSGDPTVTQEHQDETFAQSVQRCLRDSLTVRIGHYACQD